MSRIHDWRYNKVLADSPVPADPIFIVGHWRSGTTYLHELMSCDPRLASPTTFQCFAANHFLITESWLPKIVWFLMPSKRPMDNVKTGWNLPQEDEFALCALGVPSPYLRIAFPNEPQDYLDYLDLNLSADELAAWQTQLQRFLKSLTIAHQKRLILKSPTHTSRIATLAKMFPKARFLHIVRDPRSVYPSTMKLWRVLDEAQGLQIPNHENLKAYVLKAFVRMYQAFEQQRTELDEHQIFDVRYEDLVRAPVDTLREAYQSLALGDFEQVEPALKRMTDRQRDYRTNQYSLSPELTNEIMTRWGTFAATYGYHT